MFRIGVVGFGYWGPNLVRNFSQLDDAEVAVVADRDPDRLAVARKRFPSVSTVSDAAEVIRSPEVDAVVVATPVTTHYELARAALEAGKHVLVEKPMTTSRAQAEELVELAEQRGLCLMVDHTFLYTGAVCKMKELISEGRLGEIEYFDSVRVNLGQFQHDVNVIWDLAAHDVSIYQHLVGERPRSVITTGISHTANKVENLAYITLKFPSNRIAHFTSSWISPVKMRRVVIGGSDRMMLYDDLEPTEKVKLYDTGYHIDSKEEAHNLLVDYRVGDIHVPKVDNTEALSRIAREFVESARTGAAPLSDGALGVEVVRILEAVDASLRGDGAEVRVQ